MAVIGKIRERVGLLIAIVGVSLVAFILGDLLTSNSSSFFGPTNQVAEVNEKNITINEFEAVYEQLVENYKINNQTDVVDQPTQDQLREQAWTQILNEQIYGKEYEELGLKVTSAELFDLVQGREVHPQIKQAFTNPETGEFNPSQVIQFLKNMDQDPTGNTRRQWLAFEFFIKDERQKQKYLELIKKGIYVTSAQAKADHSDKNRMATIKYIQVNYNTIPDSSVAVTDSDLKNYFNENKSRFQQAEATRKIEFVTFDVRASNDDIAETMEWMNERMDEFRSTQNDSLFLARFTDAGGGVRMYSRENIPPVIAGLFDAPTGTIEGPYLENNQYHLAKLVDIKERPDSVKARHILFRIPDPMQRDSIMKVAEDMKENIIRNKNFEEMAKQHSTDGSAEKGGDLGWFTEGMMVGPFNDAAFEGKKGDMPIVETQFGIHIIEITDQSKTSPRAEVALLVKDIDPSSNTFQRAYSEASEFAASSNTTEKFDNAVKERGLNKQIADNVKINDRNMQGLEGTREIVRWAFQDSKKGDVSKAFELSDRYVVAHLVGAKDKGIPTMDQVREQVEVEAKKEKKTEMIQQKAANAGNDIEKIAAAVNAPVQAADNITLSNPVIPGAGREPFVVGYAFGMNKGDVSKALKGETGVYFVKLENITEAPEKTEFTAEKQQIRQTKTSRAEFDVFNALKENANVEDNRSRFY
ncbi:MAG: peptidylprolyl isomerase [Bacteroidia bacterium]